MYQGMLQGNACTKASTKASRGRVWQGVGLLSTRSGYISSSVITYTSGLDKYWFLLRSGRYAAASSSVR